MEEDGAEGGGGDEVEDGLIFNRRSLRGPITPPLRWSDLGEEFSLFEACLA